MRPGYPFTAETPEHTIYILRLSEITAEAVVLSAGLQDTNKK